MDRLLAASKCLQYILNLDIITTPYLFSFIIKDQIEELFKIVKNMDAQKDAHMDK